MATHATVWTGVLSSATSALSRGYAVLADTDGKFVVATSANRTTYGRSWGVALTAADATSRSFEYQVAGTMSTDITALGAGTATWVIVNASGALERKATPASGDDVIGKCNTRGDLFVAPGVWDETNTLGGGGGGTPGGADTQIQYNNAGAFGGVTGATSDGTTVTLTSPTLATPKISDSAGGQFYNVAVSNLVADRTVTLPLLTGNDEFTFNAHAQTLTNKSIALGSNTITGTSAQLATAISDETGTGSLVFNTSPTFLTSISAGAIPATTGEIRLSNNWFVWARDSGNGSNVQIIGLSSSDIIQIGASGGFPIEIDAGFLDPVTVKAQELSLCGNVVQIGRYAGGTPDGGAGIGVVGLDDASTVPSANPTGGVIIYSESGVLKYRTPGGSIVTLSGSSSSFADNAFELTDDADPTKKAVFQCSGISAATTRTFTFPNASVTLAGTTIATGGTGASSIASGIVTSNGTALSSFSPGANVQTFLTTPSSANLASAVTDETGSGALVFANTPTLVTPVLGAATATSVAASSFLSAGATVAATGDVRLGSGGTIKYVVGGTDKPFAELNSSSEIILGGWAANSCLGILNRLASAGEYRVQINSSNQIIILETEARLCVPLAGDVNGVQPFRIQEAAITKSDATDLTLSGTQGAAIVLNITGTPGGAFNIIASNTAKSFYIVINNTASACTIKKSGGTGVTIAASRTAQVYHSGSDYVRLTADSTLT